LFCKKQPVFLCLLILPSASLLDLRVVLGCTIHVSKKTAIVVGIIEVLKPHLITELAIAKQEIAIATGHQRGLEHKTVAR